MGDRNESLRDNFWEENWGTFWKGRKNSMGCKHNNRSAKGYGFQNLAITTQGQSLTQGGGPPSGTGKTSKRGLPTTERGHPLNEYAPSRTGTKLEPPLEIAP